MADVLPEEKVDVVRRLQGARVAMVRDAWTTRLRHLCRVQRRRELPARAVQAFQVKVLRDLYRKDGDDPAAVAGAAGARTARDPVAFRLVRGVPALRHLAGRFIGYGIRTEHVRPHAA